MVYVDIDAQRIRDQLRHGRLGALPLRMGPHDRADLARRPDAHLRDFGGEWCEHRCRGRYW